MAEILKEETSPFADQAYSPEHPAESPSGQEGRDEEDSSVIQGENSPKVEIYERPKKKIFTKERFREFLRWYFRFDVKDIWNYVLLAAAILIFWWSIRMITDSMAMS
ncbi:hypothetical protein GF351_00235 [Candidatus Woesearchaeota archaeon]|nr:hypothetical protein [Candidatus Woesearchaeota archaeon]